MFLEAVWVVTLVSISKAADAGLVNDMKVLNGVDRIQNSVIRNEAKSPLPQAISQIYSPSPPERIIFGTTSSHELDASVKGLGAEKTQILDDGPPIHELPRDPTSDLQASPGIHWKLAPQAAYQRVNQELLNLGTPDLAILESTEVRNCRKVKPDGLSDFSVTDLVKGDGNCQYRAISLIMTGSQEHHLEIRNAAITHMATDSDQFKNFANYADPEAGGSWETYLEHLATPPAYGNHLTLTALAQVYQRKFVVLSERSTHDGVDILTARPTNENAPISLLYLNDEHYELLLSDKQAQEPSLNNLGGSSPPNSYRPSPSSSSGFSDSDTIRETSLQDNPRYKTYTMELPKSQMYKVESYIIGPSGEAIPEHSKTPPPFSQTRTEIQTTDSGGGRNPPAEADTIPDSDLVPLIDRTHPATEHQSPTDEVYSPLYGARFSQYGKPTGRKFGSRLMDWFQKFWSTSFRSIWKKIMSMFKRNRKQMSHRRENTPQWPLLHLD